ncbi:MAG: hypothetical protein KC877_01530 [Candidatus Kaiserbacteria bacterium]|nr:hypothetical protein [Candidatus Kaiserbacteria bacterium]
MLLTFNVRGWQKPLDQHWTNPLDFSQVQDLRPGDKVWIRYLRTDDIVHGFILVSIAGTTVIPGGLEIRYATGGERGSFIAHDSDPKSWPHELTSENAVYAWTHGKRLARHIS